MKTTSIACVCASLKLHGPRVETEILFNGRKKKSKNAKNTNTRPSSKSGSFVKQNASNTPPCAPHRRITQISTLDTKRRITLGKIAFYNSTQRLVHRFGPEAIQAYLKPLSSSRIPHSFKHAASSSAGGGGGYGLPLTKYLPVVESSPGIVARNNWSFALVRGIPPSPHPARSIFVSTVPGSSALQTTPSGALRASSLLNIMARSFDNE